MKYSSLKQYVDVLKKEGELVTIDTPVDPDLEMAEITRRVFEARGPALLFTRIKTCKFPALSNLFGTWDRTQTIFEPQLSQVKSLVDIKSDPGLVLKSPRTLFNSLPALFHSFPIKKRSNAKVLERSCSITDLPMIKCWPGDGGAFILLPQVFSKDPEQNSIFTSNLGMYRIQISGNEYDPGNEIGLHYQLHRGIGNHHKKAIERNQALRVSIFIGGPPAHTLAAVMPLPEGIPEIAFAGALAGQNFKYTHVDGHLVAADADFCITGIVVPGKTKKEGPFGDHLGYYSMAHEYPCLRVTGVYHRKDAIFPFTVVGRPPQEDTNFGRLIHEITKVAVKQAIPGVTAVNAVDDAGVHPLLLAKAHERYVPYEQRAPRELLTHANQILGTGQLSLAKYLFICAHEDAPKLDVNDEKAFFIHMLERVDFHRDIHFLTKTTMDTLDYSTRDINQGSKLVMAAAGEKKRHLGIGLPKDFSLPDTFCHATLVAPGMVVLNGPGFYTYPKAKIQMNQLKKYLQTRNDLSALPLFVVVDDAEFAAGSFANFLWVTFLRSNPSHDMYGVNEKTMFKHWQCDPPLIIDARIKPFHAKALTPDKKIAQKVDKMGQHGGELFGII
ncbi:MAG: UbiD family decarboxylase [Desulfobacula sp.]|nr:UbiD family decarboxylase [Desulfobacula sp.]